MPSYLITGASRGIGLEFVRQISTRADTKVFALVRNKAAAKRLQEIVSSVDNVHIVESDIVDYRQLKVVAAEVSSITGGSLDVLINNAAIIQSNRAGFPLDAYPEEFLEEDLNDSFQTNVTGVIHTINAFLPLLHAGSLKKVITITSGMGDIDLPGLIGIPNAGPYSISKAAVNMVNAKYAVRFKGDGFTFLGLSPGLVDTSEPGKIPTEAEIEGFKSMMATFQAFRPTFKGPFTPEESVRLQLAVIDRWTVERTGEFVSHNGDKEWLL